MTAAPARPETAGYADRAKFYDVEYTETRDHAFLISRIRSIAETVMVLPGGTGTTAYVLHRAHPGLTVYSIDIEPAMVAAARERFTALDRCHMHSCQGDMTDLRFDRRFDRILIAREAFQMLPDDESALSCLRSMKAVLATGGEIVLDIANFDAPADASDLSYFDARRENGRSYLDCQRSIAEGTLTRRVTQFVGASGERWFRFEYTVAPGGEARAERYDASLRLRRYDRADIEILVKGAGLGIKALYGDYDLSAFTPRSPRLCFILG